MVFTELLYFIWVNLCHAQRFPLTWKENILCPLIFFRKERPALNPMVDQFGLFYYFFWWVIQVCNILLLHNLKYTFLKSCSSITAITAITATSDVWEDEEK